MSDGFGHHAGSQHLVDAPPVEIHDLEQPVSGPDLLTRLGNVLQLGEHQSGNRRVGAPFRQRAVKIGCINSHLLLIFLRAQSDLLDSD